MAFIFAYIASAVPCRLRPSGPVVVTTPNTVVELLNITSDEAGRTALTISGADNVTVKNVLIHHASSGKGIFFSNSHGISIENVEIIATGYAGRGPNECNLANKDCDSIHGESSRGVQISGVVLTGGSTGVELELEGTGFLDNRPLRMVI